MFNVSAWIRVLSITSVAQSNIFPLVSIIAIGSGYTVTVSVSELVHPYCVIPISVTVYSSITLIPLLNVSVKFIVESSKVPSTHQ